MTDEYKGILAQLASRPRPPAGPDHPLSIDEWKSKALALSLTDYQRRALTTAGPIKNNYDDRLAFIALTIAGESGELSNKIKKILYHDHPVDPAQIIEELGDILWYLARAADLLGYDLAEIAQYNLDKLARRYPQGFSSEASINRPE